VTKVVTLLNRLELNPNAGANRREDVGTHHSTTQLLVESDASRGACPCSTEAPEHQPARVWHHVAGVRTSSMALAEGRGARLQNVSTTGGELCGLARTAVNEPERTKRLCFKRLEPEVARHHQLRKQACSEFESLPPSHC
jgi:hypothetical protein